MIKITRKLAGDRLHISDTYITDGHWAVPRVQVDPRLNSAEALGTICNNVQLMAEDKMQLALSRALQATREWTVTAWIYDSHGTMRRIAVAADGTRLYLKLEYCTLLGIAPGAVLYANDASSPVRLEGEAAIVLMPFDDRGIAELPALPSKAEDVAA